MSEITVLHDYLKGQRRHVLGILEGLSDEQLRRPVLPSGWNCLGLVRHLAVDVERFWFRGVVDGDPSELELASDAWQLRPGEDAIALYRREGAQADRVIAGAVLDGPPKWWPDGLFGPWRLDTVREVMLHVIAEVACHAGHLDAARELIDGRQWMVSGSAPGA